jgi:hypothetical protein
VAKSYFQLFITDEHVAERSIGTGRPPGFVQPIVPEIVRDEISVRVAAARALVTTSDARAATAKTVHHDVVLTASTSKSIKAVAHGSVGLSRMVVLLREDEEFLLGVI